MAFRVVVKGDASVQQRRCRCADGEHQAAKPLLEEVSPLEVFDSGLALMRSSM
jgi:hypothetical protein